VVPEKDQEKVLQDMDPENIVVHADDQKDNFLKN